MSDKLSNQIYKSRDEIRSQIVDYMRSYLEIENADLTKSSFLSFLVNTLATLTSNILFYQSSVYREFFLTKAQMKESVYELVSFLGYQPQRAEYATVDCLVTVPLNFDSNDVTFEFPVGYKAKAENIDFISDYKVIVNVKDNSSVTATVEEENRSYNIPVGIEDGEFFFIITLNQYSKNTQEFQIDEDLNLYQFVNIDVPIEEGGVSDIKVFVKPTDSSHVEEYSRTSSLFLLNQDDRGFVDREYDDGVRIYFGNGLIGYQPEPGSTVIVETTETLGSDGNVIPGSIENGERIYVSDGDDTSILDYEITNTSSATGGRDEESLEEIRHNAIDSLTSLNRLVSNSDYNNFELITDTDIIKHSTSILKRSDLKVNEIQVYTTLNYENDLVPTRNEILETTEKHINRGTVISSDDKDFVLPFDLTVDDINRVANYDYIINSLTMTPVLVTTYDKEYRFTTDQLTVYKDGDLAVFELRYNSEEDDSDELKCKMRIVNMDEGFEMVNDSTSNFKVEINYENLSDGELNLNFDVESPDGLVATYSSSVVFKQNLYDLMMSNLTTDSTGSGEVYVIYDVPVIEKSYYDDIDKEDFETKILQNIVGLELQDYRMLTDFNNVKFSNTIGKSINMLNNITDLKSVKEIVRELPEDPSTNDRYILESSGDLAVFDGEDWVINKPSNDTISYVEDLGYKIVYSEGSWIKPTYDLPLKIELEVFTKKDFSGSEVGLIEDIKDSLVDEFSDRFGSDSSLYKSEITDVVHTVDGVSHCHIIHPKTNIFFNYSMKDLTQQELLEYSPEYIHFTKDTITIRLY